MVAADEDEEAARHRHRAKNVTLARVDLVVLFYLVAIVKLTGNIS